MAFFFLLVTDLLRRFCIFSILVSIRMPFSSDFFIRRMSSGAGWKLHHPYEISRYARVIKPVKGIFFNHPGQRIQIHRNTGSMSHGMSGGTNPPCSNRDCAGFPAGILHEHVHPKRLAHVDQTDRLPTVLIQLTMAAHRDHLYDSLRRFDRLNPTHSTLGFKHINAHGVNVERRYGRLTTVASSWASECSPANSIFSGRLRVKETPSVAAEPYT